ncbi:sugar ABC transporter ATP-binding protein [Streptomyces sp. DSM 44917]|uniref:Sugar ABC transporter ATP-binding protein n=1 Tax=Streptomyces boetiae TaxID=3075541 RepID=A0ABU2LFP1_9ACTN|nr:sugar ABC transporter ATP-binding protein [Streptomyces sp. DSM 44917]MDT0310057.1 sugar ABC transporter ATP-binding protein [Streptomyces sp. DSM 44917]
MRGIVKHFPGVRALDGIDLEVAAGEVHCLLGQNGAGKSTLIKVLAGAHQPDAGTILWRGEAVRLPRPQSALDHGIATLYQELDLVDGLTVAENIHLGHEKARLGLLSRAAMNDAASALLRRLGHPELSPAREVGRLPAAGRQIVSLARALSYDARLIVMDEPSAVLGQEEVGRLFSVIGDLAAQGIALVYISHRLEEIRRIGDRITVLKDGRTVASGLPVDATPAAEVIRLMTGRSLTHVFPPRAAPGGDSAATGAPAEPVLRVEGLTRRGEFRDVSFDVRPGEILGLAGLVGSGRSEILETVYGARRPSSGTVRVAGRRLRPGRVGAAMAAGVGFCPEERKSQALLRNDPVYRNVSLPSLSRFARAGFLDAERERRAAAEHTAALDVRPAGVDRPVGTLSGGNQQKVVLARWLLRECRVLLLDEPTRGVDVGARAEIYALIRELAGRDIAVVVVSSEIEEVIGLSDRVLVISEGRIVSEAAAEAIDEHRVLDLVMEGDVA